MSDISSFQHNFNAPVGVGIRRGLYTDLSGLYKFGYNSAVGGNYETVWDGNNVYTYIASAGTAQAASDAAGSADDTATVLVQGLDSSYNPVEETLTVGGSAGTVEFYRIFRAQLVSHPTGNTNIGEITITADSKSAAIISEGQGQTLMALYTVPAGKRAYVVQLDVGSSKDLENEIRLITKNGSGVWNTKAFITTRGGFMEKNFFMPTVVDEKLDIEIQAKASATSAVSAAFEVILEDK